MAVETGISPTDLLATDPAILDAMLSYLVKRAEARSA